MEKSDNTENKQKKNSPVSGLFKKDPVLCIAGVLAAASCFFICPDKGYKDYVNYRVLAILFSLMLVVSALEKIGSFRFLTARLLSRIRSERMISLFLVFLSFFLSMLLTNDVTLVTLVPFAIMVLSAFHDDRRLMFTLIFMTIAANLGSMLTPIGNPQNLYLYTEYAFTPGAFFRLMLPPTIVSAVLLLLGVLWLNRTDHTMDTAVLPDDKAPSVPRLILYAALFVVAVLTVAGYIPWPVMLGVISTVMLVMDYRAFAKVDYALLLTFVFFFILIGNLGRIDAVHDFLSGIVEKNVMLTGILSSQIISNVPAAMLLSAFTDKGSELVLGVNMGGLGTLIASMASLITCKFYMNMGRSSSADDADGKTSGDLPTPRTGSYILSFTVINVIFLVILYVATVLIRR